MSWVQGYAEEENITVRSGGVMKSQNTLKLISVNKCQISPDVPPDIQVDPLEMDKFCQDFFPFSSDKS